MLTGRRTSDDDPEGVAVQDAVGDVEGIDLAEGGAVLAAGHPGGVAVGRAQRRTAFPGGLERVLIAALAGRRRAHDAAPADRVVVRGLQGRARDAVQRVAAAGLAVMARPALR